MRAPSAPSCRSDVLGVAEPRQQVAAGLLQVVPQQPATSSHGLHLPPLLLGLGRARGESGRVLRRVLHVELPVDVGGREQLVGEDEHQRQFRQGQRLEKVAYPPADGRSGVQEEGHVGPQPPGQPAQLVVARRRSPGLAEQLRAHLERGGRVGAASPHAGGEGDALVDGHPPGEDPAGVPLQRPQSVSDDVGLRLDGVGLDVQLAGAAAGGLRLQA